MDDKKKHHNQWLNTHLEKALQLIAMQDPLALSEFLSSLHPVEAVHVVESLKPEHRSIILSAIPTLDQLIEIVALAGEKTKEAIIEQVDQEKLVAIVHLLEPDDSADFIGMLEPHEQRKVLNQLPKSKSSVIYNLLKFPEGTVGALMTPMYMSFPESTKVNKVIEELTRQLRVGEVHPGTSLSYIYLTNDKGQFKGVCSIREILTAKENLEIIEIATKDAIYLYPRDKQETAAQLIKDYDLTCLPVIDPKNKKLSGLVTIDDLIDAIEEKTTEDILKLAGTEDEDVVGARILVSIKSRFPWLLASWMGGTLGAFLLSEYSNILQGVVALAFFMPVIFGMGGNIGSQSSIITVRGIATGDFKDHLTTYRLFKESVIGGIFGITFGCLLGSIAWSIFQDFKLAITIFISITCTMSSAAFLGSFCPILLHKLNFDPAIASGPFVTTATDLISITIYFSIASMLFLQ